jgi:hypothetical protein
MTAIPKIKLESVERFERDYKLRLPFRFGVITVTEGTQAVIRARIALEDGRTAVGVAAEALGAKWFDKSPAFQRCPEPRPAAPGPGARHRALSGARLEHAFGLMPTPIETSWRAAPTSGWCRWWPPMARRCSTAPSSMRWGGRWSCPSPT